jgi:hypothetical protein
MDNEVISNINELVKTIEPYIKAYGTFSASMTIAKKLQTMSHSYIKGLTTREHYDIDEVFNEIESENLKLGSIIEVSGKLFKYGQVFKPYTHVNCMFSNCAKGEEKEVYIDYKKVISCKMTLTSKAFQPPIQKIPSSDGIGCAFIYDTRFKGFEHELNPDKDDQKEKPIIIDKFSKPIMVLYDIAKQGKYINREVVFKGRVINIPTELSSALNVIFDNYIRDICSNFYRPYNESINFICISLLDGECTIREMSKIKDIELLKAPLYVEAQFEGLNTLHKDQAQKLIESIIPNLPQKLDPEFPITVGTFTNNIGTPFLSINNINVIFREPEIIGFYCDTEIFNSELYSENIKDLIIFINNFVVDYQNITKKYFGKKMNVKLNFLFDFEKQNLFDKRGVLNSNLANDLYQNDESSRYVQNWLKNSPNTI